jgi:hypothetical protein
MVAVAAGLVAPVVTQPSRPASSFADDVQAYLDATFVDMTVVVLDRGTASGYSWQLAAVRGTIRHTHVSKVCLVRRLDVPGRSYGISCLGENSQRDLASLTFGGGLKKMPLWGLAPQGTARVRLLGPKGTTPIEVPAKDIGPGFDRSYYLAPWTPKIQTVLAFDGQGDQIARYPPRF